MLEEIPRKIKIIVNPNAGGGNGRRIFPLLREKLLDRKIAFHLQFSESPEQATHLARQAQGEGYNYIVSCGGDGTAHRVIQSLVRTRWILGLIPVGRGNDFPRNLGIEEDLDFACNLLQNGKIRKVDVLQVDSGSYILGVGALGFGAEVSAFSNRLNRVLPRKVAYSFPPLIKTLFYRPRKVALRLDQESLNHTLLMVAFGNTKSFGRGMQITPLAEPDDGLMDICCIDPVGRLRLYRFFPTVYTGEHLDLPEVHYYRSTTARVDSSSVMDFYGDGEFICRTPFTLRVVPQALRVLVP